MADTNDSADHAAGFAAGLSDEPAAPVTPVADTAATTATASPKPDAQPGQVQPPEKTEGETATPEGEQAVEVSALDRLDKDEASGADGKPDAAAVDADFWPAVMAKHPDAQRIAADPAFNAWLAKQDEATREIATNGGVMGAVKVLNDYKRETAGGTPGAQQTQSLTGPAGVQAIQNELMGLKFKDESGAEKSISDFVAEVGDYGTALTTVFSKIAEMIAGLKGGASDGKQPQGDELRREVADIKFWQDVSVAHPDARKVWNSKEFAEFWKSRPDHVKRKYSTVANPDDAAMILDAFKEHVAKGIVAGKEGEAQTRIAKTNGLYKGALRGGKADGARVAPKKEDDYHGGFAALAEG